MDNHSLSPKNLLLARSQEVLRWLHDPAGLLFSDWLSEIRLRENKKLMEAEEQALMFRAQGSVGMIDLILSLEDDLKQYQSDLREGKIKEIKEV